MKIKSLVATAVIALAGVTNSFAATTLNPSASFASTVAGNFTDTWTFNMGSASTVAASLSNVAVTLGSLPTRDAVLPMLALLCMARERACQLSALTQDLPARYTASDRLQDFATHKSQRLIQQLLAAPAALALTLAPQAGAVMQTDQTDGLRVTFESGDIVHLRPLRQRT
ncbi:hypothetical protein SBP18_04045 [Rhodoferax ferrireducens]|uniref:hypothetical protein n=1 Tax=Rhodoferax ferrireducens TaxID=192843 RepID=UPI00298EBD2C|nr:hypothetical protein [Rhodoferax ferrireducens]WPC67688.1 hypothetical protein SBP18_04045 [Rhodoferax ferrireducens]